MQTVAVTANRRRKRKPLSNENPTLLAQPSPFDFLSSLNYKPSLSTCLYGLSPIRSVVFGPRPLANARSPSSRATLLMPSMDWYMLNKWVSQKRHLGKYELIES
jgi:hypothetical protein